MKYKVLMFVFSIIFFSFTQQLLAQKATVFGSIEDAESGERLLNATVQEGYSGALTNDHGSYSLSLPTGIHELVFSYVGYQSKKMVFNLTQDTSINVQLSSSINLDEVTVTGMKNRSIQGASPGSFLLSTKQVSQLPVLLGETDLIKAVQLLPGVQACNEASGALMVRGGGADGNLILLDDIPIFNVNHLFGLFSVFDPNAIKSVQFYNGGFPAKYGGRSSSVLDLRLKDGNKYNYHGNVSVGVVASKIFVEGPITKGKSSFIFSARRTYLDGILSVYQGLNYSNYSLYRDGFYFYDVIGKISWNLNQRNRLFFSVYTGSDEMYSKQEKKTYSVDNSSIKWGNVTSAIRWNHQFSPKLFSNLTATHTIYNYKVKNKSLESDSISYNLNNFDYNSYIRDLSLKLDANYYQSQQLNVGFGAFVSKKFYNTGNSNYYIQQSYDVSDSSSKLYTTERLESLESGVYAMANFHIFDRLDPELGVRVVSYSQGDENYLFIEPRMSLKMNIPSIPLELEGTYTKMHQYIQLLSNYGISLPVDLWIPATLKFEPVASDQIGLGVNYQFKSDYRFSLNTYMKTMNNLVDYKIGKAFSPTDLDWTEKIVTGKGRSKGLELLAEKQNGKLKGWISYTLSNTENQFDDINNGVWYPASYDHRHEVHVVGNYDLKSGMKLNFVWVYGTGRAVTLPESKYYTIDWWMINWVSDPLFTYTKRNGARMPTYHRLDGGISFTKKLTHGKRTWSMGVYNLYNRKNPYYLSVSTNSSSKIKYDTNSMLSFLPYLTYSYEF